MPKYYTRKGQVPLGEGQTLGFQPGRGYYAKGTAKDPLLTRAQEYAETVLSPSLEAIRAERAEADRMAQRRAQAMSGYSQAAAQMLQSIGPQVQQGYADAAGRTAHFGKGYSVGMQIAQQGAADEANRLLAMNNAPAGQQQTVTPDAADVLYGTGGVIPATSLEREGAAFGAAASQLPATQLGMGRVSLQALMEKAAEEQRDFDRAVREIESKRPGVVQEALAAYQDQALKQRAQKLNEEIAYKELGIKSRESEVSITGVDPVTGKPVKGKPAKPSAPLSKMFGYMVDEYGNPIRGKDGKLQPVAGGAQGAQKPAVELSKILGVLVDQYGNPILVNGRPFPIRQQGNGGLKPAEIRQLKKEASEMVDDFYNGIAPQKRYVPNNPPGQRWVNVPGTGQEPLLYWEALKRLISAGIPYRIARQTLDRYYKPGEGGRPKPKAGPPPPGFKPGPKKSGR